MRYLTICFVVLMLSGCAGTGFNKRTTMMPDEVSLSADYDPHAPGTRAVTEITGGFKWKLK